MACFMCESHMNEAIRRAVSVKKVASSHRRRETVILSDAPLDEQVLRDAIAAAGYQVTSFRSESCEKKGLFSFFR